MRMLDREHTVAHGRMTKGRQRERTWSIRFNFLRSDFPASLTSPLV
jgi:hypothetical protein